MIKNTLPKALIKAPRTETSNFTSYSESSLELVSEFYSLEVNSNRDNDITDLAWVQDIED